MKMRIPDSSRMGIQHCNTKLEVANCWAATKAIYMSIEGLEKVGVVSIHVCVSLHVFEPLL